MWDGVWYVPVGIIVPVGGSHVGGGLLEALPLRLMLVAVHVCHPDALPLGLLLGAGGGDGEEVGSPQDPVCSCQIFFLVFLHLGFVLVLRLGLGPYS